MQDPVASRGCIFWKKPIPLPGGGRWEYQPMTFEGRNIKKEKREKNVEKRGIM
jgi:hypothetical protein